jgi:GTPase Era involved in 16S rRNA processing
MTYEASKGRLQHILTELKINLLRNIPDSLHIEAIEQIMTDLEADYFTVVVVGEFKRGKSMFINAMLGEPLLPVDVTPTTATINALIYGEERKLSVYKTDGTIEECDLNAENLEPYVVGSGIKEQEVRYLKMALPSPMLKNRVVLVDTPGVDDLNMQRAEVTYKFIPRADAVLFLIDLTSPVRRTEKQFLEDALLKEGHEQLIFIGNFKDLVDEEELGEALALTEQRLATSLPTRKAKVFPLSASQALTARQYGDPTALALSGLPLIEAEIHTIIENGTKTVTKLSRYRNRLYRLMCNVKSEIELLKVVSHASKEAIELQLQNLEQQMDQRAKRKEALDQYVIDRTNEINLMVRKSLQHFTAYLKEDLLDKIHGYRGADFKIFVENDLQLTVKRNLKQWIEQHTESIHMLLMQLEQRLAEAHVREFDVLFNSRQHLHTSSLQSHMGDWTLSADDVSNTSLKAGLFAGGAGALAMLLGSSLFLPMLSLAGYPLLQKLMLDRKLTEAKEALLDQFGPKMDQVMEQFQHDVLDYISDQIDRLRDSAAEAFDQELSSVLGRLRAELNHRKQDEDREKNNINALHETEQLLNEWLTEISPTRSQETTEVILQNN